MKKTLLIITICLLSMFNSYSQISLAAARAQGTGTVTVRGVVSNGSEFGGSLRYIQDGTGGIAVFNSAMGSYVRGDSVLVSGTLTVFNGLLEIATPSFTTSLVQSGVAVHSPLVASASTDFVEANEGVLLQLNNVTFSATGNFAGNTNYTITQGAVTEDVRINSLSNLVGTPIPVGPVNIRGILGEFSGGTPTGTSYQFLMRDVNDILFAGNPPIITSPLWQDNITTTGFNVLFNTQNPGSTIIKYGLTANNLNLNASTATNVTAHNQALTGLTAATVYFVQGLSISATNDTSKSAIIPMMTASNSTGNIKVYFNRTVDNSVAQHGILAQQLSSAFDDTLIAYLDRAASTIDICVYNIDNNLNIITALNAATTRGVNVRLVYDAGVSATTINSITTPNKVISTNPTGIQHNKFIVIDKNDVNKCVLWTGSMNFTDQQVLTDAQNIIIIQDQSLAIAYDMEFEEMYTGQKYGTNKVENTPHYFMVGGKKIEMYFSPTDGVSSQIKKRIASANYDIYTATYSFTRTDIAYAIIDSAINKNGAYYAGVNGTTGGSDTVIRDIMASKNVTTYELDNQPGIFHHKYCIIDPNDACSDPIVITGSANWTNSGDIRNDENLLIIHDSTIANIYYQEFVKRYTDNGGALTLKPYKECVQDPGGLQQFDMSKQIKIFPNPANNYLSVNYSGLKNSSITIFNLIGVKMYEGQLIANETRTINTELWQPGTYIVKTTNNQSFATSKIVIQN
jgi:phosphatidylserine/phosphatidylglycerophosphate/cardiolipin synthase-like enzyme